MTSTVVRARVDERVKREAAAVLSEIGLTVSDAFRMMMVRIAKEKALPFEPLIPNAETIEAMEAARRGEFVGAFKTVDELLAHLNADDYDCRPIQAAGAHDRKLDDLLGAVITIAGRRRAVAAALSRSCAGRRVGGKTFMTAMFGLISCSSIANLTAKLSSSFASARTASSAFDLTRIKGKVSECARRARARKRAMFQAWRRRGSPSGRLQAR